MRNFINLRIQSAKENAIKHNFRTHTSNASRNQRENATTRNKVAHLQNNGKYQLVDITDKNIKDIRATQRAIFKEDTQMYKKLYKARTGRNPKDTFNAHAEGVLTFSEAIDKDLGSKYTLIDLANHSLATIQETCKKLGTTMIQDSLVFHFDEKRVHTHWKMKNFDDNGKSIMHKNKSTKILSSLQDIAAKYFGKLGIQRGIKRVGDTRPLKHQTTIKYYKKQISDYAHKEQEHKQELEKVYTALETQKQSHKEAVSELKKLRNEITETNKEKQIAKQEIKQLYAEISSLQKQHREENKTILAQQKIIKAQIKEIVPKKAINKSLHKQTEALKEKVQTHTNNLEIVKDIAIVDESAKTFKNKLVEHMTREAEYSAVISPSSKLFANIHNTFFPDSDYDGNMDYKFTTTQLEEFLNKIITYASKRAFRPHGTTQKKLVRNIKTLQEKLKAKEESIPLKEYKALEQKLAQEKALRKNSLADIESIKQERDNFKSKNSENIINYTQLENQATRIIQEKNTIISTHKEQRDKLESKVTLLQNQKSRLLKKVRDRLYPQEHKIFSVGYDRNR